MSKYFFINLEKYTNTKLTLPAIPHEYIDINFLSEFSEKDQSCNNYPFSQSEIVSGRILESQILADGDNIKKVYEFLLDAGNENYNYFPGDTIGIPTFNFQSDVKFLIEHLGIENIVDKPAELKIKDKTLKKGAKLPIYIPKECTIRKILEECLDLRCVPKKLLLRSLSSYTTDETDKHVLDILASQEGKLEYENAFLNSSKTLIDIFTEIKSCRPPVTIIFEHLTRLMPRPYSIASSSLKNNNIIRIVFSILENGKSGVTTTYLENLLKSSNKIKLLNFYFRTPTKFRYTNDDLTKNLIMIGPGTGVAPYIGFLEHRHALCKINKSSLNSIAWLFTGHRYSDKTNLYSKKLLEYKSLNVLTGLFQAFSRDLNSVHRYVQDLIIANSNDFVKLFLDDNTMLYVCGEGKTMCPDIEKVIRNCLADKCGFNDDECKNVILEKKKLGKYIEDVWF